MHQNKISALNKRFLEKGNIKWKILRNKEKVPYKRHIKEEKIKAWRTFCFNQKYRFGQAFKISASKNISNKHFIHTNLESLNPYTTKSENFTTLSNHYFSIHLNLPPPAYDLALEGLKILNPPPIFSYEEIS